MKNIAATISDNIRRAPGNPTVQRVKNKSESQALAIASRKAELRNNPAWIQNHHKK